MIQGGSCADPVRADAAHQRLLHFAADSPWSDHAVRREASRYAIDAMTEAEPIDSWIPDPVVPTRRCNGPSRRVTFLRFESRCGAGSATDRPTLCESSDCRPCMRLYFER